MAKCKAPKKPETKIKSLKSSQRVKSQRKTPSKMSDSKTVETPVSYKESHSIGRRQSTNVATYSESGRLYYDLHVKYGPVDVHSFESKSPKSNKVNGSIFSNVPDNATVSDQQKSNSISMVEKDIKSPHRRAPIRRRKSKSTSTTPTVYTRREASLNAEAKVNMLFESPKGGSLERKSVPTSVKSPVKKDEPLIDTVDERTSPRRWTKRSRASAPEITYSPPQRRMAGLNASAINRAVLDSPKVSTPTTSDPKPKRRYVRRSKAEAVLESPDQLKSVVKVESKPEVGINASTSDSSPNATQSNTVVTMSTQTASAGGSGSVVPTVERFQSQKFISYGPKYIGVENISRQIYHVPAANQPQLQTGPSTANQPQRLFSPPNSVLVNATSSSAQGSNQPMLLLSNQATDMQHCLPGQFYVSPFAQTQHPLQTLHQPSTMLMPPSTLIHPTPQQQQHQPQSTPFQVLHMQAPHAPSTSCYMFHPLLASPLYAPPSPLFPPQSGFAGNYHLVPRPMFSAHHQPQQQIQAPPMQPQLPPPPLPASAMSRVDRAVSPMPQLKSSSGTAPASTPPPPSTSTGGAFAPAKKATPKKAQAVAKKTHLPCQWVWEGMPSEKPVFTQPNAPPETHACYPSMRHQKDGMVVRPGDNVLVCSGPDRHSAPHVAKVTALFASPQDGTKMMALMWYYRPESIPLSLPRRIDGGFLDCELFASRHFDVNPVDCIDDRAYVLSSAPYARFMAMAKYKQEGRTQPRPNSIVPPLPSKAKASGSPKGEWSEFAEDATLANVFLCRGWYDFRSRRIYRHLRRLNNTSAATSSAHNTNSVDSRASSVAAVARPTTPSPTSPILSPPQKASSPNKAAAEQPSNGGAGAVLETTAEFSINWGDHGEQIALALGSTKSPHSPSPRKKQSSQQ